MIFDSMTNALYGSDGTFIKTMNCPMTLRLSDLTHLSKDSPDRYCHICKETVVGINDLNDSAVREKVASTPNICLFATSEAKNVIFLKPIGERALNESNLPVVKTARSFAAMIDAQRRGLTLVFKDTGIVNEFGESKATLFQNRKTRELWLSGDYRCSYPEVGADGVTPLGLESQDLNAPPRGEFNLDDWMLVKEFFFIRPDRPMPIAAYLIPKNLSPGAYVFLEDLIEDLKVEKWNQGDAVRMVSANAVWTGSNILLPEEDSNPLAQG